MHLSVLLPLNLNVNPNLRLNLAFPLSLSPVTSPSMTISPLRRLLLVLAVLPVALAAAPAGATAVRADAILLTIFLRHDQSRPLGELNAQLDRTGWREKFPPAGVEVVSWYVMMGIGQVVTVRVPPEKLREVNLAVENGAWGAYRTEFYPTYDYRPVWEAERRQQKR